MGEHWRSPSSDHGVAAAPNRGGDVRLHGRLTTRKDPAPTCRADVEWRAQDAGEAASSLGVPPQAPMDLFAWFIPHV